MKLLVCVCFVCYLSLISFEANTFKILNFRVSTMVGGVFTMAGGGSQHCATAYDMSKSFSSQRNFDVATIFFSGG